MDGYEGGRRQKEDKASKNELITDSLENVNMEFRKIKSKHFCV